MNAAFWANKKVLITGADGFIGSHLVEYLQGMGASITALCQYNSFNDWGWLEKIADYSNLQIISGDIRDHDNYTRITAGIDIVFHLASLIAVPYSLQNPRSYVDTNIVGTLNMCQAALKSQSKLIYISSSEVYGTAQYLPIDEKHPLQAQSPYSASKIGAEAIVYSFYRSYGLNAVIARPFNTYGPRQSARAIIPSIIIQLAGGEKEIKLGSVTPRRDMNYVTDTCTGMAQLAVNDGLTGNTINIGSGKDYSVFEIYTLISQIMKMDIPLTTDTERVRPFTSEVEHLLCDNSKIKMLTGFTPVHTIESGLDETIKWFMNDNNMRKYKNHLYNV